MITLALLIVALILFVLAAIPIPSGTVALGWLGAACATLALIVDSWPG